MKIEKYDTMRISSIIVFPGPFSIGCNTSKILNDLDIYKFCSSLIAPTYRLYIGGNTSKPKVIGEVQGQLYMTFCQMVSPPRICYTMLFRLYFVQLNLVTW